MSWANIITCDCARQKPCSEHAYWTMGKFGSHKPKKKKNYINLTINLRQGFLIEKFIYGKNRCNLLKFPYPPIIRNHFLNTPHLHSPFSKKSMQGQTFDPSSFFFTSQRQKPFSLTFLSN